MLINSGSSRFGISLLLMVTFLLSTNAIENNFHYLTPDDGLSQGNITAIYQDSKGFMWFGTFQGVNRFDGYSFKVLTHIPEDENSLSHPHVKYILEDDEQKLWFGTFGGGVSVYNVLTGVFKNIQVVNTDEGDIYLQEITGLIEGPDGNIWVLDHSAGLFIFSPKLKLIKSYRKGAKNEIPAEIYYGLAFDNMNNPWVVGDNSQLFQFDFDTDIITKYSFEEDPEFKQGDINTLFISSGNMVWIGTPDRGAYLFNPQNKVSQHFHVESLDMKILNNSVTCFEEDWNGNIIIGSDGGGITSYNPTMSTMEYLQYNIADVSTLNTNAVYSSFIDKSQTLWIGTYSGGVNYQSRYAHKFESFKPSACDQNTLSAKNVTSFLEDSDGEIWIGTDGGGINKFDRITKSFTHYKAEMENPDWLHTNIIISMMQDSEGDIFINSYNGGLSIYNKETNTFKQYLPDQNDTSSIAGMHPWYSFEDSYGVIWVGLLSVGLDRFDKETETFSHYTYSSESADTNSLYSPNIKVIYEDADRQLWIGTEGGGIHRYNRNQDNFTRFYHRENDSTSIIDNDIRGIYEDSKGRFWVSTSKGLSNMDRETGAFIHFTSEDGLPGDVLNDILEDSDGNLWISTDMGITKFNPDSMTFRNYDISDGLQGNEFNYTAAIKSTDGYFYFGGKQGFSMFDPDKISDDPYAPDIILTGLKVLNQPVEKFPTRINGKMEDISIPYLKDLTFKPNQNKFSFEFSALSYSDPELNKYKYKLEGYEKDWIEADYLNREVTYNNLKRGNFTFRVIGANSDGLFNEEGLVVEVTVKPPFWKRVWFILLVIFLLYYAINSIIKKRQQATTEEKNRLEAMVKEGMKEVEKQKSAVERANSVLNEKLEAEEQQKWISDGLNQISNIISHFKDDYFKLSQNIIVKLVEYLEVEQGALYLLNDDNEKDKYLEITGIYVPDDDKQIGKRIETEEGNVGICFQKGEVVKLDNLPTGYAYYSSGLGNSELKHSVIIPLKLDESVIGAVEFLSFHPIEDFKTDLVIKAGESLTSILSALKANFKTQKLLEEQKMLASEKEAQEEMLLQNLEELKATQEESNKRTEELSKIQEESHVREVEYQIRIDELEEELEKYKKSKE